LLRNDGGNANHWLEILLIGTKSNRDAIRRVIETIVRGNFACRASQSGMSYMSANDPRIFFGLGKHTKIDSTRKSRGPAVWWKNSQTCRSTKSSP